MTKKQFDENSGMSCSTGAVAEPKRLRPNCVFSLNAYLSELWTRNNSPVPTMDLRSVVKSDKKLWVYNASRVTHQVDHPVLGNVKIPANTTKKRYALYTSFPEVVMLPNYRIDENVMESVPTDGVTFVKDLINPAHIYGGKFTDSSGRDLSVKGVFWSWHNPPLKSEVNAAVKLMETCYRDLLERAEILYQSAMINADIVVQYMADYKCDIQTAVRAMRVNEIKNTITPEHHAAANHFKVTTPWHPVLSFKETQNDQETV